MHNTVVIPPGTNYAVAIHQMIALADPHVHVRVQPTKYVTPDIGSRLSRPESVAC